MDSLASAEAEYAVERSDAIQHTRLVTGRGYDAAVRAFERELGHLDPNLPKLLIARKAPWSEAERAIEKMAGPHDLMVVSSTDLGSLTSLSGKEKRCRLYLVGNPVIANRIIEIDLRGSFYVPFRVALYDEGDALGTVVAYDRPSSFLATLGRPELTAIAQALDEKIDTVAAAVRDR
ncbi:MAG: DUF302 domain-containing protein [Rhizomicrobium sp.]